ncbi:tRNA (adenine(58)-N(1))-methyltransferase non-catalytic subunit TRM6 isoform X1 [Denticeps clupeoides]|uniref:tRNA (adenine(58)-N(1))-methyltransferase non-catalytic subunit TRM6 isoform X1 n=2 Tax=Denticeps clupeoides TaxID=299321 RepID=UPI0010A3BAFA|nr:tRNA (adenine(58)-N(1))-methyltransferase non-catalytic subunit TRM6 isoform X1 [Denticeps clupeoides]
MANDGDDPDAAFRVRNGDYVVLKRGDVYKSVQIQSKRKVVFEKQWFFLDNAVGQLYGTTFEVESGGTLKPQAPKGTQSASDAKEAGTDNRNIVDDGRSQKLTKDDIESLKEKGLKGQEIIQHLIDNSTTFRDKTEFAQEKYIKKKKKKYESSITILKPTARILALMYHGREWGKVCHLRYDTLAQMLTLGNIRAGSKVIVFETCAGLVLGAVMERLGGYGTVIQMYPGGGPTRAGMESFGFPPHFHDTLYEFPLCKMNALLGGKLDLESKDMDTNHSSGSPDESSDRIEDPSESGPREEASPLTQEMETSSEVPGVKVDEEDRKERERRREMKSQEKKLKMEEKRRKLALAAAQLEGRNADGLVIASRFHPCPVLLGLLKFLSPSRPFVVYCQYREPLIECYTKLREQGGVVNLHLSDSWLRHYQVLPNRTHPVLLMSGGGGYLLTGTTVAMDAPKTSGQPKTEEPSAKRMKLQEAEGSA